MVFIMPDKHDDDSLPTRGIYLLPNLLTTAGLFSGFYAVVSSMNGHFISAAVAIFIAMIFDGLDGRVARMTNTQSEFGAEYDSMADMVSFGLAAFIYVACAALRLARFNTQVGVADKRYFQGLASPAAAGVIASLIWVGSEYQINGEEYGFIIGLVTIITGLLMVSNFRYNSFKDVDWKGKVNFVFVLLIVLVFVVIASSPENILLLIFGLYACSGPFTTIRSVKKLKLEHVLGDDHDAEFRNEALKKSTETAEEDTEAEVKDTK